MIRIDDHNQEQHFGIDRTDDRNREDRRSLRRLDASYHCCESERDHEAVAEEEAAADRCDGLVSGISYYHLVDCNHYSLKNTVKEEVEVVLDWILVAELEGKE